MKSNWRQDYFLHPDWKLWQDPDHFCFNTDTRLLAEFMRIQKGDHVLDIGTNNGALLLAADHGEPGMLSGVEILPEAAELARANALTFRHPCTIVQEDVRQLQMEEVDVIVCNPPYFPLKALHPDTKTSLKIQARHEVNLTLDQLLQACHRLLKSHGRLFLVHRPSRLQEIMVELAAHHFAVARLAIAYDKRDGQAKSLLIEAIHEGQCEVQVQEVLWI